MDESLVFRFVLYGAQLSTLRGDEQLSIVISGVFMHQDYLQAPYLYCFPELGESAATPAVFNINGVYVRDVDFLEEDYSN